MYMRVGRISKQNHLLQGFILDQEAVVKDRCDLILVFSKVQ